MILPISILSILSVLQFIFIALLLTIWNGYVVHFKGLKYAARFFVIAVTIMGIAVVAPNDVSAALYFLSLACFAISMGLTFESLFRSNVPEKKRPRQVKSKEAKPDFSYMAHCED